MMFPIGMKRYCAVTMVAMCLAAMQMSALHAEDLETYRLDEITVIADRQVRYIEDPTASVTVLTREDIDALNATTITEVLSTVAAVDIRERGAAGSQADIAIRGSSIEGVLVLVDGVRVHDPQTGHYTLDLPVGLASVERIEVLSGGGAGIYGGSAPGGVINIVTGGDENEVAASLSGGSYGSGAARASVSQAWEHASARLDLRTGTSDGYRADTDLVYTGLNASGDVAEGDWRLKWNMGMLSKSFGAGDFYGPYPSSEKTATYEGGLHLTRVLDGDRLVRFRAGSRGHDDTFTLVRSDPSLYQNLHYNRSTSAAAEFIFAAGSSVTVTTGIEIERFGITSGSLGAHSDLNSAIYTQFAAERGRTSLMGALRYDAGYRDDHVVSPVIGIVQRLTPSLSVRLRAERSYRPPTYTELYYDSPANMGNTAVRAEYQSGAEAGLDYSGGRGGCALTVFASEATDVIDWIRNAGETVWRVENHGRLVTGGMEAGINRTLGGGWRLNTQAMFLNQSVARRAGIESKYALNPLDRVVAATLTGPIRDAYTGTLTVRHEHQRGGSTRTPVGIRLGWRLGGAVCRLAVDNLFDESYDELPGLPAPGRWITIHLEYAR